MFCIFLTLSTSFTYALLSYRLFGVSNSVNLYNKLSCYKFSINCLKSQLCHIYCVIIESIKIKSTSFVRKKCTRCIIIFGEKKMIIKYLDEELGELILKHIKKVWHILLYQTNTFIMDIIINIDAMHILDNEILHILVQKVHTLSVVLHTPII